MSIFIMSKSQALEDKQNLHDIVIVMDLRKPYHRSSQIKVLEVHFINYWKLDMMITAGFQPHHFTFSTSAPTSACELAYC